MADAQPAAVAQEASSTTDKIWSVAKSVGIFVAIQYGMKQFIGGGVGGGQNPEPAVPDANAPAAAVEYNQVPNIVYPLWPANQSVDISMFISPSMIMPALDAMPAWTRIMEERNFSLEKKDKDAREVFTSFSVPKSVQDNGTLWTHVYIGQTGAELDPASPSYDPQRAYRMSRPLTQYLSRKKVAKTRNLLSDDTSSIDDDEDDATIASYYHPNITLSFVPDTGAAKYPTLHPATRQFYELEPSGKRDATGKNGWYYPVLYFNTFWQLRTHMTELNSTIPTTELDLNVNLNTLSSWQFTVMASMDEGMKETARKAARGESTPGGGDGSEMEMIKNVLLDSNIYLLSTTVFVSILHMIFELLAFKSDVSHWRQKKDNVGTSVRTILANVFMQSVIFLYLMDNNDNTSWMILFGQGMGIAIEAWKITKSVNVRVREPQPNSFFAGKLPYVVVFEDKHKLSETEEKTEEYDRIAFKYMGVGAVPLLLAYAVYSLLYESHKSWYSFIITTLVGSVYAYGFLMMIPSLYINYRLQSVAHMPARAMTYKFLNTFIDDLFAFTIKMPTLHRLATLRDDLIFFVYLYQAWKYKVDYTRVNEFGQGGDDEEVEEKLMSRPLKAVAGGDGSVKEGREIKEPEVSVNVRVNKGAGGGGSGSGSGRDKGPGRKRK
ncbi:hypothetical protein MBLNU230_g7345t2 [Neophaeotheca triangularis]